MEESGARGRLERLNPSHRRRLWAGELSVEEVLEATPPPPRPNAIDVLVVGSGMAGVVAAQELEAAGLSVRVLEAGERGGGRAVVDSSLGPALDMGAAWIHCGEENPLTGIARDLGLTLVPDPHRVQAFREGVEETEEFARSLKRVHQAWHEAGKVQGSSREYNETADEVGDFLVLEGLGRVVEAFTHGLAVELNRAVEKVRWSGEGVEAVVGERVYRARLLILTPAVGVLSAGGIEFVPALPKAKLEALDSVRMGCLDKIVLKFEYNVMRDAEPNSVVYSKGRRLAFLARPFGLDMAIGFVGGQKAAAMALVSPEDEIEEVVTELVAIYGEDVRASLSGAQVTRWCQNPFTRGSYSSARPGQQAARRELCRPEKNLILAGEACHDRWAGTLTGAYLSGLRAARDALAQLSTRG